MTFHELVNLVFGRGIVQIQLSRCLSQNAVEGKCWVSFTATGHAAAVTGEGGGVDVDSNILGTSGVDQR